MKVDPDGNVCLDTPVSLLNLSLESSVTFLSKIFRISYFFLHDIKIIKKYTQIYYHLRYNIIKFLENMIFVG